MNNYEAKKQARIDYLKEKADKFSQESLELWDQSNKMADCIPFGQPILVGHHSEKKDRNFRNRIRNKMDKACEIGKKAEYYNDKALAAENNNAISSDDPEALQKLKDKKERLTNLINDFKRINDLFVLSKRNIDLMNVSEEEKQLLKDKKTSDISYRFSTPENWRPFPSWKITNLRQNIKSIEKRINDLEKKSSIEFKEEKFNDIILETNPDENRLKIFFPDKPSQEIINDLKSYGFRWSNYDKAWKRMISNQALYYAKEIIKKYNGGNL